MSDQLLDFSSDARIMVTDERLTSTQRERLADAARKIAGENFRDIVLECDVRQACIVVDASG